jgi:hypothetical protein
MGFEELPNQRGKVTVHAVAAIPGATNHIDIVILATTLLHAICNQPTNQPTTTIQARTVSTLSETRRGDTVHSQPASQHMAVLSERRERRRRGGGYGYPTGMHSQS